jgi:hypothetical protein
VSVQAISWVIDRSRQKGGPLTVLIMIANHAHSDGTGAFPSFDTLARESRMSYRQISRIIPQLAKSGELRVRRNQGPNGTNLYEFPLMNRDILSRDTHSTPRQNVATPGVANVPLTVKNRKSTTEPNFRAQTRSERDRFDEEQEQRRRSAARDRRLLEEDAVAREIRVGQGPEVCAK